MAGGIGARFWPASTKDRPKQFLDILGIGKSLIRLTYERALRQVPNENILIITNSNYKDLVMKHLPELPEANILCEPSMNNTAPSVAYTALRIHAMCPDAVFAIVASDHVILHEDRYIDIMDKAMNLAATEDVIVTLGIQPTRPDTGYGYINFQSEDVYPGFYKVNSFKEKPDLDTAITYVNSGQYLWNAGIFVWSTLTILKAFKEHAPKILSILSEDSSKYNTSDEQAYVNEVYPQTERISVDYAILERAENVYTIPADIGWSDLGTWNSLHAYMRNVSDVVSVGQNIHLIDSEDLIVISNNYKQIVIKGLKDYIVIDEQDALLIYPKSDEQEIKEVVKGLGQ